MLVEFRLPELGENITSGLVGKVLVAVGDIIKAGENVLEIETDKAVAEIPCPTSGRVVEIRVKEGAKISSGDVVLVLDSAAASGTQDGSSAAMSSSTMRSNDQTNASESVASIPTDKVTPAMPVTMPRRGTTRAAPSIRRLAREHEVDINDIPVADPGGKVTAEDVLAYIATRNTDSKAPPSAGNLSAVAGEQPVWENGEGTSVVQDKWGEVVREAMTTIRGRGAERLTDSWQHIPHVTHFDKADISDLEALRGEYAAKARESGVRLTAMAFILKVLPEILKRFPRFNASVDMENKCLLMKRYYHIGFAVDTPNGLVVPVLQDTDRKTIFDIALEMGELSRKARERKLALNEIQGGTFTVSNLGGLGGTGFTPIINAPEVAILGLSRALMEPVYNGREFIPHLMLPLSLSYDHRIIDGADAARFLRFLAGAIEQPWRLMVGL